MIVGNHILINGDCLEVMPTIESGSVDMILCDLPYGTTACKWDVIIPFDKLWKEYERIIKPNGAIVLTASQPFTTDLINSNRKLFKYELIWEKPNPSNPLLASKRYMSFHENICIFYKKQPSFNSQKEKRDPKHKRRQLNKHYSVPDIIGGARILAIPTMSDEKHPSSVIKINRQLGIHPTQKPVALFEYLIKTYTNEGETVLDNCAGSFTTAVACENTGRKSICIEREEKYFNIGVERVRNIQPTLFKQAV